MPHKFDKTEFEARQQAKVDHKANVAATPNPSSVPQLVDRVKLLEKTVGL